MFERLLNIIKENMPEANLEGVNESSRLIEDIGLDSIGMMMLSMAMEEEFGVSFDEPVSFITVQDVIDYLNKNAKK